MSVAKFMPKHPADLIRLIIKESAVFCVNLLREVKTGFDTLCVMPHDAWEFRWMQMMISTKGKVWGDEEKKKKRKKVKCFMRCDVFWSNASLCSKTVGSDGSAWIEMQFEIQISDIFACDCILCIMIHDPRGGYSTLSHIKKTAHVK